MRAYIVGFSTRSFFQVSFDKISTTTLGAGPVVPIRQLASGRKETPLMTAMSGATGGSGPSTGGKKAKFSQTTHNESRKSHLRTAIRYQMSSACGMLSGSESSSKKGERSSHTSIC